MIGFPGIRFEFSANPILWRITDNFALTWYGLIFAAGFLLAVTYCLRLTRHFGLKQDEVIDMLFFAVPAGIIGARLYYVAFNWSSFSSEPLRILYTWEGGIAIYGSIIGSVAAACLFCWVRHISMGAMLDIGSVGLLIGQAVGRWGNFVNGEVYGKPTTLPWRMRVYGSEVHPLFLYESLWNLLGLVLLRFVLLKRRKYNGQMFTVYIAWYGLGRGLLEGLRNPAFNLMLFDRVLVSQVLALASLAVSLILLFYMTLFRKHPPLLEWTVARDQYEAFRKERKNRAADGGGSRDGGGDVTESGGGDTGDSPGGMDDSDGADGGNKEEEQEDSGDGGDTQWDYSFQNDKE